jgi:hypothetical protein
MPGRAGAGDALGALRERVATLEANEAALQEREAALEALVHDLAVATEGVLAHRPVADTDEGPRRVPGEPLPGPARDPEIVALIMKWEALRQALAAIQTALGG